MVRIYIASKKNFKEQTLIIIIGAEHITEFRKEKFLYNKIFLCTIYII